MAVLGNQPAVPQNQGLNTTNMARMVPGQFYQAGSLYGQGLSFGTPRNWSHGGQQMYDPQYVRPLQTDSGARTMPMNTGQTGLRNVKPTSGGGVSPGMPGYQSAVGARGSLAGGLSGGLSGGGLSGGFSGGNLGQIQTSIQPKEIYDPWMTNVAVNQAVANADQRSNLQTLMGQFDTPGVSRSSRHAALAAPLAAQQQLTAADAKARIPFEDTMANQRNMFLGQVARENEMLGLGNLSARMYEAQNQDALSRLGTSLGYLQSLIG